MQTFETIDGNEAVARVAYALNEVIAIYPITPATPMGEWADTWMAEQRKNLWGTVPSVIEMQSEAGAAGAVHGALQTGSLATTFTASQGLLLMVPNMYKIAGELTPAVFHVAARSLAVQALSIFGDHSDVMAARSTGWAMLCSASVQEAHDFALIAQAATLQSRIPFLHFFDGFRTSHEISKIAMLSDDILRAMVSDHLIAQHRARSLSPDRPVLRGTAQNPDVYFQARETVNPFYAAAPEILQQTMDKFAALTGRQYHLFQYHGSADAEKIIILMGSACETASETVDHLVAQGEKVGVLKVRSFRPFDPRRLIQAIPTTVKSIAVLDRTKEPGSTAEPLHLDVISALFSSGHHDVKIVGGRYGLSSKEFTPAMVQAVFRNLSSSAPKNSFTIGIQDDVSHTSLDYDSTFSIEPNTVFRALFYGLGSDGTVGANKDSIKIFGENSNLFVQAYFVYDSKKSGAVTISHLRSSPAPIRSTYLIAEANFIGCHQPLFLEKMNVAEKLSLNGTLLVNSPVSPEKLWNSLPQITQERLIERKARLFVIDASRVARDCGIHGRINVIMQVCFFSAAGILPMEQALPAIRNSIRKTYGKKGEQVVQLNLKAIDHALANLFEVTVPSRCTNELIIRESVSDMAPSFVRNVLGPVIAGLGDQLPVSALPVDGTFPTNTARWEKRNLATEIPVWNTEICIQCGKCVFVCPHSAIRGKVYEPSVIEFAPSSFKSHPARHPSWKGSNYTLQIAPEDCTGCGICVEVCPVRSKTEPRFKALTMEPLLSHRENERLNWDFFLALPEAPRGSSSPKSVREVQTVQPLFEFSGACAGCGETPYLKLLSQLFGDRLIVANATGCSSIFGGNMPTTPWAQNSDGRGPAWSNSLFEDNAEFGLGFRVSIDKQRQMAAELLESISWQAGESLSRQILDNEQRDEADIFEQRLAVAELKSKLETLNSDDARRLLTLADLLVRKSVWIIGGDGWAYDIGFGGLDHVLASGRNVKVLVLDTETYSNTGGQTSKATPRGAVAKFSSGGKPNAKKDLGLMAMTYGTVYVASVAMGAKDEHTLKTFLEAEAFNGPALIIAHCHCIAHGINMSHGLQNQKAAVDAGQWLLYRFNPDRAKRGEIPLQIDSASPRLKISEYLNLENRFRLGHSRSPGELQNYCEQAQADLERRWNLYQHLASHTPTTQKTS